VADRPDQVKPTPGTLQVASLGQGPGIEKLLRVAKEVWKLPQEKDPTQYQLRILRIPALHTEVIWLKATPDRKGFVIPFRTFEKELQEKEVYTVGEFLEIIRRLPEPKPPRSGM
jgi:hypothetical protein